MEMEKKSWWREKRRMMVVVVVAGRRVRGGIRERVEVWILCDLAE